MRGTIMAVGAVVAIAVLLLVGILLSVEFGLTGDEGYEVGPPMNFDSTSGGKTLAVALDPEVPAVGRLAVLSGVLTDASGNQVEGVRFDVSAFHLEDEKNMASFSFAAPDGAFSLAFQFFDGAGHRISVTASPAEGAAPFDPVVAESEIDVAGFDPPLTVKIKTIGYLLMVVLAGVIAGLFIRGGLSVRAARLPPKRAEGEQTA